MRYFPYVFSLFLLLSACDPDEACVNSATNEIVLRFVQLNEAGDLISDTVQYTAVYAIGADTAFYAGSDTLAFTQLVGSLNPGQTETVFVFSDKENSDTLIIGHEQQFRLISPDCGLETRFGQLEVRYHSFGAVTLNVTELDKRKAKADLEIIR